MASVASKLSRAARIATAPGRFTPGRFRHVLAGDTTFTIWTRPLFLRANGAAASPLGPRFLRRGLANLPTGSPVGLEHEDLEDCLPDPATNFHYDEEDLASEESMWAMYERWCSFHKVAHSHDEMRRRFDSFKAKARHIYDFNKSGSSYTKGLNHRSDMMHHEFTYRRVRLPPPEVRMGSQLFLNEKGEIIATLTNGVLKVANPPSPRIVKPVKMIKLPET